MEFVERESDGVEVEFKSRMADLDLLGVPGLLDALHSVLEERGLLPDRAPSVERLRDALAGRFRIVGELGRGGNAVVYLAYETALERPIALKVLLASRSGPDRERDRLLREARTATKLSHPNIVFIHAVEQAGEFVFFIGNIVSRFDPLPTRVQIAWPPHPPNRTLEPWDHRALGPQSPGTTEPWDHRALGPQSPGTTGELSHG